MDTPVSKNGLWRIGEIAKKLGVTTKTLRHYERMGLLRPPQRTSRHYRMYNGSDVQRARHLIGLRRLGLSLEEIRGLLEGDKGGRTRRQRLLGLLDERLREIDETLAVLQGQRDDLAARYLALIKTPPENGGDCICAALVSCNCQSKCSCCSAGDETEGLTVEGLLRDASRTVAR
jgi:DNA-binding transcriptional MerR regulator